MKQPDEVAADWVRKNRLIVARMVQRGRTQDAAIASQCTRLAKSNRACCGLIPWTDAEIMETFRPGDGSPVRKPA